MKTNYIKPVTDILKKRYTSVHLLSGSGEPEDNNEQGYDTTGESAGTGGSPSGPPTGGGTAKESNWGDWDTNSNINVWE